MLIGTKVKRFSKSVTAFFGGGTRVHLRNITEGEALAVIAMYQRERDDLAERLLFAEIWNWLRDEEDGAATVMQRPGIQNGLRAIEEMEAAGQ